MAHHYNLSPSKNLFEQSSAPDWANDGHQSNEQSSEQGLPELTQNSPVPLTVPSLPSFFSAEWPDHQTSVELWKDWEPLNQRNEITTEPQVVPQQGWTSYWPRQDDAPRPRTGKGSNKKRPARPAATSLEDLRPIRAMESQISQHNQSNRYFDPSPNNESSPKAVRIGRGYSPPCLQQSTRSSDHRMPVQDHGASEGQVQAQGPAYSQENKPWCVKPPSPESSVKASGSQSPECSLVVERKARSQFLEHGWGYQFATPTGRIGARLPVPQLPPPNSVEIPDSAIRFNMKNEINPGVLFTDLEGNCPGLIRRREPAFPSDINPGGVVMWITWPGYPAWRDRLATTKSGHPINLAELGLKIVSAYRRFIVDHGDNIQADPRSNPWYLGEGGVIPEKLYLTRFQCIGGMFWQADVELLSSHVVVGPS